jgi:hypothetical protein
MTYNQSRSVQAMSIPTDPRSFLIEPAKGQILENKKPDQALIEVVNIQPVNKNSLLCKCDVHIIPWKMTIKEISVFEKGANRWIALPSRQSTDSMGQIKYHEQITFDSDAIKNRFRNQIMGAIDKFIAENPEMKVPDLIQPMDDLPW